MVWFTKGTALFIILEVQILPLTYSKLPSIYSVPFWTTIFEIFDSEIAEKLNTKPSIMALQIKETNGMFQVYGNLNAANARILKRHMNNFSDAKNFITLNLEKVSGMDASAAHMLRQLYLYAMRNQRVLSIIGEKNANILPIMNKTKTSYILSHDRV